MVDRDGLLVIRECVGRDPVKPAQRPVKAHHHRPHRLVAQRQHHPVARPRQPRAKQHRRTALDHGPVTVVPLQPQARLGDPRPGATPMLAAPEPLGISRPPPCRPRRTLIAQRDQLAVRGVRADPPARALHQLIDLGRVAADRGPAPRRRHPAGLLTHPHPVRDRLVITASQRRRTAQRARQVIRLKDLHHCLSFLHHGLQLASRYQDTGG